MIVTAVGWGGLGVQLNQFSSGLALSASLGVKLEVLEVDVRARRTSFKWDYKLKPYEISKRSRELGLDVSERRGNHVRIGKTLNVDSWVDFVFQKDFFSLPDDTMLLGIRGGFGYHEKTSHILKDLIRLDGFSLPKSWSSWEENVTRANTTVVHVRLGDYLKSPTHHSLGVEYFESAFEQVTGAKGEQRFLIFSDEPKRAEKLFQPLRERFQIEFFDDGDTNKPHLDLELMSMGHNFVMSNSTFSWWAAFLNRAENPVIVAPHSFFAADSIFDGRDSEQNNQSWRGEVCSPDWIFIPG